MTTKETTAAQHCPYCNGACRAAHTTHSPDDNCGGVHRSGHAVIVRLVDLPEVKAYLAEQERAAIEYYTNLAKERSNA